MIKRIFLLYLSLVERMYLRLDQSRVRRTRNIQHIPSMAYRRGGKVSYGEWSHVIGVFQTLLYQVFDKKDGNRILDVGCGTGLLGLSAQSFVSNGGKYTGIDVKIEDVEFCRSKFPKDNSEFIHFDVANATYSKNQSQEQKEWPIANDSQDAVTALSVWTHLNEADATFYLKEVARVLRPGGRAIITFFRLDQGYEDSLSRRSDTHGRYHATNQNKWIFTEKAYDSSFWLTPKWTKHPEDAVGVTEAGVDKLLEASGLKIYKYYPGNWKENVGVYFQDVLIFEKAK